MGPLGLSRVRDKESQSLTCALSILFRARTRGIASGWDWPPVRLVFFVTRGHLRLWSAAIAGWNAVAVVILALDWVTILTTPQRKIRELAQQQDLSRFLVFLFVVVTSSAALFAVGFLVSVKKSRDGWPFHHSSAAHALDRDLFLDAGSYGLSVSVMPMRFMAIATSQACKSMPAV